MRTKKYVSAKMLLLLMLATTLGGCTEEKMGGGEPLPEGKYPVEFTSQMYGMEVTRATSANTWEGSEEIAIRVANDTRKYTVSEAATGKITAAAGVTPFYWTSTGETKNVSAIYPYALASADEISVNAAQDNAANYQASDALYAAETSIAFSASTKQLTFKHLPAKVVANLKAGDGVETAEVQGATVKFVSQSLSAPFDNATGVVTAASPGSSTVTSNVLATPDGGFQKKVQALLVPCQMQNNKFIEVAIGNDKFYYTPTNNNDGKLESGKVSTYEITVKRNGIEVKLTQSNEWGDGGSEEVQSQALSMTFYIDLKNYDNSYTLPFPESGTTGNYTLFVSWGDDSPITTIDPNTDLSAAITHTYSEQKEYKITISTTEEDFSKPQMPEFIPGWNQTDNDNNLKLKRLLTPLLNTGATDFSSCFNECSNLTGEIPEGLFVNNTQATNFSYCFYQCSNLTEIPERLFANNTQATNFEGCFWFCSNLSAIPAGLFANNTEVTTFSYCFNGCSNLSAIPAGLFNNNTKVENFSSCFYKCSSLLSPIPEKLFANNTEVTTFSSCFSNCTSLTTIPAGLFANNTEVTTFSSCFNGCSNLSAIPAGLFNNNTKVENFSSCFYKCSRLKGVIPEDLFAKNILVTNFSFCFAESSLSGPIPEKLFANNTEVTTFSSCFRNCTSLSVIPAGLFANNTKVTNFSSCFAESSLGGTIPEKLFANNTKVTNFSSCFAGCSNLNGKIPEKLFVNNTAVTNFTECLARCNFREPIPEGLFDKNTEVTTFSSCFAGCSNLPGPIPEKLFDNNTKVANFGNCFSDCSALSGTIPEELFAKNTLATNFSFCFYQCTKLVLSSNIFCNELTEKTTRFAEATSKIVFNYCFYNVGTGYVLSVGKAPELWEYTYKNDVTFTGCFRGAKASNTIDAAWQ